MSRNLTYCLVHRASSCMLATIITKNPIAPAVLQVDLYQSQCYSTHCYKPSDSIVSMDSPPWIRYGFCLCRHGPENYVAGR